MPLISKTLLYPHIYEDLFSQDGFLSEMGKENEHQEKDLAKQVEEFYEEIFMKFASFGEIDELEICDNIGDHMIGNVYVKYFKEEDAATALHTLRGTYYAGRVLFPEYSHVTNFREYCCRQYEAGTCSRGGYCNFMHWKEIPHSLRRALFSQMYEHPDYKERRKETEKQSSSRQSRSRSPKTKNSKRKKSRSRSRSKSKERKASC